MKATHHMLLAKLSWRIIKNPSGLLARCLLGKYCKESNFLSVQATKTSSHGWKSVLVGRNLLIKTLGWTVGCGTEINVWNHPWLSSSEQLRPFGPVPEHLQSLTVSELMLENSTDWDLQKIEQIIPFHKDVVLQIKPSICNAPDELVWLRTASGEYSTKSGYRAEAELPTFEDLAGPAANRDWLANVWKLKTAEKIKVFIWNSLHDALPVGEQFAIRNIPLSPLCTRCNEMETVFHVIFGCTFARKVWNLVPLASIFNPNQITSTWEGADLLRRVPSLPPIGVGPGSLSAWIYWNLWIARNQLIFQKRSFTSEETILKAIREAREWTISQTHQPIDSTPNPSINQDPPSNPSRTCMYTDAAWNSSSLCAGLAWIIDDTGSSSSHSATSSHVASPLIAETLALRDAMNSALHRGYSDLLILSNSQIFINLVKTKGKHLEIATLLADIQYLSTLFTAHDFKFIPRKYNVRTDLVAKQALSLLNPIN